jgi:hypothetical protein
MFIASLVVFLPRMLRNCSIENQPDLFLVRGESRQQSESPLDA